MKAKNTTIYISLIAIAVSLAHVAIHFIYSWKYSVVDSESFLSACIGVVALLIVFSVSWQIINVGDIKDKLNELNQIRQEIQDKINTQNQKNQITTAALNSQSLLLSTAQNWAIADLYYALMEQSLTIEEGKYKVNHFHLLLKYTLFTIRDLSIAAKYDDCNIQIKKILNIVPDGCTERLNETEYQDILATERLVKRNDEKMPNYILMLRRIHQLDPQRPITSSNLN